MRLFAFKISILLFIFFLGPHVVYASKTFTVQAGAFSSGNNAQNLIIVLQSHGIQCAIYEQKGLSKVHCGEFSTQSKADILRKRLSSLGFDAFVVPKIIGIPEGAQKADIPAEQPIEVPVSRQPETEHLPPPVTSPPEASQPPLGKSEIKIQEQKQEVISAPQAPVLLNRVVAVVNKEIITWSELYKAMEFEAATQVANLSADERKKLFKQSEASFLESLIDARLQLQEAQKLGLETTQKEITDAVETIKKKYSMTQTDFMETLRKEGLTFDGYKKRLSEEILINKVVAREIRNKIVVSDDEIMKYIEEHKARFRGNDKYRLRQIFFRKPGGDRDKKAVEERAELIIKRLRDGEDFSALARVYSDEPSSKIGGDLGFVSKDLLAKEFIEVITCMKVGDYSTPFWTEKGLHIIRLEDIVSAVNADEVRNDVRKKLAEEQFAKRYKIWIKGLREKAYVEVRL